MSEVSKNLNHLPAMLERHFLRVPTVGDWFVFVGLDQDVSELFIGYIFQKQPTHLECALPLPVLHPHGGFRLLFTDHFRGHFGHAQELP